MMRLNKIRDMKFHKSQHVHYFPLHFLRANQSCPMYQSFHQWQSYSFYHYLEYSVSYCQKFLRSSTCPLHPAEQKYIHHASRNVTGLIELDTYLHRMAECYSTYGSLKKDKSSIYPW